MASFLSIWLTRKCLPTSRRKSRADIPSVQSRLLTKTAAFSPVVSRKGRTWSWMRATHSAVCSLVFRTRSEVGRGSPMRPVEPPTRQITRCPARWRWRRTTSWTRLPKCSEGAVGSNPQYAVIGPSASAWRSADSSVVCATSPRHCSSSRMSVTSWSFPVVSAGGPRPLARPACHEAGRAQAVVHAGRARTAGRLRAWTPPTPRPFPGRWARRWPSRSRSRPSSSCRWPSPRPSPSRPRSSRCPWTASGWVSRRSGPASGPGCTAWPPHRPDGSRWPTARRPTRTHHPPTGPPTR